MMVEIRPAVPKPQSLEFLRSFADELADAIGHGSPTVQPPKRKGANSASASGTGMDPSHRGRLGP